MLETEPAAIQATTTNEKLIVELADGRGISIPLAWYPRLLHGSSSERKSTMILKSWLHSCWRSLSALRTNRPFRCF